MDNNSIGARPSRSGFTIADVLAWARTKPADEAYDYCASGECAIAQFLRETGRVKNPEVDPWFWTDNRGKERRYPDALDRAADKGSTFGEFVEHLESIPA